MSKTNAEIRNEELREAIREYGISNLASTFYEMLDEIVEQISGNSDLKENGYESLDNELLWGEPNWNDIAFLAIAKPKWDDPFDKEYALTRQQIKDIANLSSKIKELAIGREQCNS